MNTYRSLIIVSGDCQWCCNQAHNWIDNQTLYIGNHNENFTRCEQSPIGKMQGFLGRSLDRVMINCFDGLSLNGLGIASGLIRQGGQLILLIPPLNDWSCYADPDLKRLGIDTDQPAQESYFLLRFTNLLKELLKSSPDWLKVYQQGSPIPDQLPRSTAKAFEYTADQQAALHQLIKSDKTTLVQARRGRGKSTIVGKAIRQLIDQNPELTIGICAPSLNQAQIILDQLTQSDRWQEQERHQSETHWKFYSPDELVLNTPDLDLLVIDEAAAIPTPLVSTLLDRYSRTWLVTTVQGYEGTGRGFELKVKQPLLTANKLNYLQLQEPVRWQPGDPLERFVDSLLLVESSGQKALNDSQPELSQKTINPEKVVFKIWSKQALIDNPIQLQSIFSLLVQAHYQTSPDDLRGMLDNPKIQIACLHHDTANIKRENLLGVALLVEEGPIDPSLLPPIWLGLRRPRGAMVPQLLLQDLGPDSFANLTSLRIMRIGIGVSVQRQGLGHQFLSLIKHHSLKLNFDYLSTSFGLTQDLFQFWHNNGFKPVRLGIGRDKASGTHSAIFLFGLNSRGNKFQNDCAKYFSWSLPKLSNFEYKFINESLIAALVDNCREIDGDSSHLSLMSRANLHAFAHGKRQFEVTQPALLSILKDDKLQLVDSDKELTLGSKLLIDKVLHGMAWKDLGNQGKNHFVLLMRKTIATWLAENSND